MNSTVMNPEKQSTFDNFDRKKRVLVDAKEVIIVKF